MTAGIFIEGWRPTSKKQIKAVLAGPHPSLVSVEDTSMWRTGFNGPVDGMAVGQKITFVGPDPYTSRKFFGTIERTPRGYKLT